jgi:chorismate mutase
MPRVVRLLAHVESELPKADVTHVYLHGAATLRSDLTRVRSVPDEPPHEIARYAPDPAGTPGNE